MAPPDTAPDQAAASAWSMVLDVMERDVVETEELLARLVTQAVPDAPQPATSSPDAPPWEALTALLPAVKPDSNPAEVARAHALFDRQQRAVRDLHAALSVIRRHRELLDTVVPPAVASRYVDQRA